MGDARQVAGQHHRAANVVGRQVGGRARHGLDHDPLERALAQLAGDEPEQETPLVFAEPREQLAEDPLLGLGGSLARRARRSARSAASSSPSATGSGASERSAGTGVAAAAA